MWWMSRVERDQQIRKSPRTKLMQMRRGPQKIKVRAKSKRRRSSDAHCQFLICRVHQRSPTTRPHIAHTGVGVTNALRHSAVSGPTMVPRVADPGASL